MAAVVDKVDVEEERSPVNGEDVVIDENGASQEIAKKKKKKKKKKKAGELEYKHVKNM